MNTLANDVLRLIDRKRLEIRDHQRKLEDYQNKADKESYWITRLEQEIKELEKENETQER